MAEQYQQRPTDAVKTHFPENRPSTSQVLAVVTLFPVSGILLFLACLTLTGTVVGLAVATPLFVIFSPILIPAALAAALAVAGFLTSGAFGITAISSISWIINYFRRVRGSWPEQFDQARVARAGHGRTYGPEGKGCRPEDPRCDTGLMGKLWALARSVRCISV